MKTLTTIALAALFAAACAHSATPKGPMAMAMLDSTSGSKAEGMVHFQDMGDGRVEVKADLTGVPPGEHGFHIHEKGDCGDNGNAAGGHFNPTSMAHGAPTATPHHAGDFGNVTADAKGEVHAKFYTQSITVTPGPSSIVGRSVVLHAGPDDLKTQPTGNSGARIACSVIETMGSM